MLIHYCSRLEHFVPLASTAPEDVLLDCKGLFEPLVQKVQSCRDGASLPVNYCRRSLSERVWWHNTTNRKKTSQGGEAAHEKVHSISKSRDIHIIHALASIMSLAPCLSQPVADSQKSNISNNRSTMHAYMHCECPKQALQKQAITRDTTACSSFHISQEI